MIVVRLPTGLGAGGAVSSAFQIAAELMPAQHRRSYGAIYEMTLGGLSRRVNLASIGSIATELLDALTLKALTQPVVMYNVPR